MLVGSVVKDPSAVLDYYVKVPGLKAEACSWLTPAPPGVGVAALQGEVSTQEIFDETRKVPVLDGYPISRISLYWQLERRERPWRDARPQPTPPLR